MEISFKFSLSSNFRQSPFLFGENQSIESTYKLSFTTYNKNHVLMHLLIIKDVLLMHDLCSIDC